MGGIIGRLFREFAVTVTLTIAISVIVSLTLTPMLCSRYLKHHGGEVPGTGGSSCGSSAASMQCSPPTSARCASCCGTSR